MPTTDVRVELLQTAGSAFVGFLAAVATFRSRFVALETNRTNDKENAKERRQEDRASFARELEQLAERHALELEQIRTDFAAAVDRVELAMRDEMTSRKQYRRDSTRRQLVVLELVADIGNKVGVTNRVLDVIPRLLSEEIRDG